MSSVPKSERKHIVFVGRRNAGKSSLLNAFLGQELCIVSGTPGTTTDPVKKAMELAPFGPIVLVDTAGIDDVGELGKKRISKTAKEVATADFVIFVLDSAGGITEGDKRYIEFLKQNDIPFAVVLNKIDAFGESGSIAANEIRDTNVFKISCKTGEGILRLKEAIAGLIPAERVQPLVGDLIGQGDVVLLVVPIDLGAPKGRLIMPQVQTIREILDEDAVVIVCKDKELRSTLENLKKPPALVITDSQAIMRVAADVDENIPLTTFSIMMARYKGDLLQLSRGLQVIESLENGDKILIAEACSHHAQEDDIGRIKIPRWLRNFTRKNLEISHASGRDFPEDLREYKLIVHCGGCTLTSKEMKVRIKQADYAGVPIVNYGVLISYLHGAIPRALKPFPQAFKEFV